MTPAERAFWTELLSWVRMCSAWAQTTEYAQTAEEFAQWFEAAYKKLDEGRPTVMFAGEFSAGKTSLINALLGQKDFLPVALDETTAIPTLIEPGREERGLYLPLAGEYVQVPKAFEDAFFALRPQNINQHPFFSYLVRKSLPVKVKTRYFVASFSKNIALLDMPGLSSVYLRQGAELVANKKKLKELESYLNEADTKAEDKLKALVEISDVMRTLRTQNVVPHDLWPDVIIWVCDCEQGITQVSVKTLESFRLLFGKHVPILIVLNKIDKKSPTEVREQVSETKKVSERAKNNAEVLTTSAVTGQGVQELAELLESSGVSKGHIRAVTEQLLDHARKLVYLARFVEPSDSEAEAYARRLLEATKISKLAELYPILTLLDDQDAQEEHLHRWSGESAKGVQENGALWADMLELYLDYLRDCSYVIVLRPITGLEERQKARDEAIEYVSDEANRVKEAVKKYAYPSSALRIALIAWYDEIAEKAKRLGIWT